MCVANKGEKVCSAVYLQSLIHHNQMRSFINFAYLFMRGRTRTTTFTLSAILFQICNNKCFFTQNNYLQGRVGVKYSRPSTLVHQVPEIYTKYKYSWSSTHLKEVLKYIKYFHIKYSY